MTIKPDLHKINRKTDSLFDWLGNWGGLLDSLNFIGKLLLSNYSLYALNSNLAWLLVRFVPSESKSTKKDKLKIKNKEKHRENAYFSKYGNNQNDPKRLNLLQNFIKSFNQDVRLKPVSYLMSFVQRCREPKRFKLIKKSQIRLDQELDL